MGQRKSECKLDNILNWMIMKMQHINKKSTQYCATQNSLLFSISLTSFSFDEHLYSIYLEI